jgi:hypothetical protein
MSNSPPLLLSLLRFLMVVGALAGIVLAAYDVVFGPAQYVFPSDDMTVDQIPYYQSFSASIKSQIYVGGSHWFLVWSDLHLLLYPAVAFVFLAYESESKEVYVLHFLCVAALMALDLVVVASKIALVMPNCNQWWMCSTPGDPQPTADGKNAKASTAFLTSLIVTAVFMAYGACQICVQLLMRPQRAKFNEQKMAAEVNASDRFELLEQMRRFESIKSNVGGGPAAAPAKQSLLLLQDARIHSASKLTDGATATKKKRSGKTPAGEQQLAPMRVSSPLAAFGGRSGASVRRLSKPILGDAEGDLEDDDV